jgi:hypothetical protein
MAVLEGGDRARLFAEIKRRGRAAARWTSCVRYEKKQAARSEHPAAAGGTVDTGKGEPRAGCTTSHTVRVCRYVSVCAV